MVTRIAARSAGLSPASTWFYQAELQKKTVLLDGRCFSTHLTRHSHLPVSRLLKRDASTRRKKQFPHILETPTGRSYSSNPWTVVALFCPGSRCAIRPQRYESECYVSQGDWPQNRSSVWMSCWRRVSERRLLELQRTAMWYALPVYYDFGWGTSLTLSKWRETPSCFTRNLIQTSRLCYHPSWGKSYFRKNNI